MIKDLKVNKRKYIRGKQAKESQELDDLLLSDTWPKAAQKHLKT